MRTPRWLSFSPYKTLLVLVIVFATAIIASAQKIPQNPNQLAGGVRHGKWTLLFDQDWKEITDPSKAIYYRLIEYKAGTPSGTARDYFADGRLQWEGQLVRENPDVNTGVCTWYFADGTKQRESTYVNGKREGKEILYSKGKKFAEGTYTNDQKNNDWIYYGTDYNSIAETAIQYYNLKDYSKAEASFKKATDLAVKEFGPSSVEYRGARWWLYFVYSESGKVTEAVGALKDALRVSAILRDQLGLRVTEDAELYAEKLKGEKKYEESLSLYRAASKIRERNNWHEGDAYYKDLKGVMDNHYWLDRSDSVQFYFQKIQPVLSPTSRQLATHLYDWASFSIGQKQTDYFGKIEKACEDYLKLKEQKNEKDAGYAEAWIAYGKIQHAKGQYERALKSFSDARAALVPDDQQVLYMRTMSLAVVSYNALQKYDAAAKKLFDEFEEWNNRFAEYLGTDYIDNMTEIVRYASVNNDNIRNERVLIKLLPAVEKEFGKTSAQYKTVALSLAGVYQALGKTDLAKSVTPSFSEQDNKKFTEAFNLDQASADFDKLKKTLATGKYNEALAIFERSHGLLENYFRSQNDYDGLVLINSTIAYTYQQAGQLYKAGQLLLDVKKIADAHLEKSSETYINMLSALGDYYAATGALKDADDTFYAGMQILDKAKTPANTKLNDELYYRLAGQLAGVLTRERYFESAEDLYFRILGYFEELHGKSSLQYQITSTALADLYQRMRLFPLAASRYEEAMPVLKKELGEQHLTYIDAIRTLANLYLLQGDYAAAEAPYLKAKTFYQNGMGLKSDRYMGVLSDLGMLYTYSGQWTKAAPIYHERLTLQLEQVRNIFPLLSEKEKTNFYAITQSQFNTYNVFAMHQVKSAPAEAGDMYNLQLVSKSMLFKATNRVRTSVVNSKDENLKALYSKWQNSKEQLSKVYQLNEQAKKAAGIDEKQLEKNINDLERELTTKSELFAKLISDNPDWKEIRATLKPGEAAVEMVRIVEALPEFTFDYIGKGITIDTFDTEGYARVNNLAVKCAGVRAGLKIGETILSINDKSTKGKTSDEILDLLSTSPAKLTLRKKDSKATYTVQIKSDSVFYRSYPKKVRYAALVVTPDAQAPRFAIINNGGELETRYAKFYRNAIQHQLEDPYSYKFFWKPVQELLGAATRIYFSPDGVYNSINPNTLYNPETKRYVLDDAELILVSNTADILRPATPSPSKKAVLIGFPDYNRAGNSSVDKAPSDFMILKKDSAQRFMSGDNITELPGTKTEVNAIESLLKPKMEVLKYMSADASEEKIKAMQAPKLLHIATHGFFLDDVSGGEGERGITGMANTTLAGNPLLRSGLLLAGAAKTITEGRQDNQSEDGVLTAYEALNLDLNETDMVVLSACETGLGQIQTGEGVYGLQRAFRAAGAQSVLMSLWKVDDQATQQLMTGFYSEWLSKGKKQTAFRDAQLKLRQQFSHPYYWGAFVMMGQ